MQCRIGSWALPFHDRQSMQLRQRCRPRGLAATITATLRAPAQQQSIEGAAEESR
jgi:hypothetical protein